MPVNSTTADGRIWQRRTTGRQLAIWFGWLCGVALFMYCWQYISEKTTSYFVFDAPSIAGDIVSRALPPRWEYINVLCGNRYGIPSMSQRWARCWRSYWRCR